MYDRIETSPSCLSDFKRKRQRGRLVRDPERRLRAPREDDQSKNEPGLVVGNLEEKHADHGGLADENEKQFMEERRSIDRNRNEAGPFICWRSHVISRTQPNCAFSTGRFRTRTSTCMTSLTRRHKQTHTHTRAHIYVLAMCGVELLEDEQRRVEFPRPVSYRPSLDAVLRGKTQHRIPTHTCNEPSPVR